MDTSSNLNPTENGPATLNLDTHTNSAVFREPPPPYSSELPIAITNDPIVHESVITQTKIGSTPVFLNCPSCGQRVLTRVEYENSRKTHLCAGFVCGITFWCALCCLGIIPYIVNTFKKANHYCPSCNTSIGSYSRI